MSSPSAPMLSFAGFLEYFPSVELPVTLGEEAHHHFSQMNDPLPIRAIAQYLAPLSQNPDDEDITEYVPCFQLPEAGDFRTIVYWKAGLLSYEYHLVTFTAVGDLIDHRVIAGSHYQNGVLTQSAATISEAHIIYIVSGQAKLQDGSYDAASSRMNHLRFSEKGHLEEIIRAQ